MLNKNNLQQLLFSQKIAGKLCHLLAQILSTLKRLQVKQETSVSTKRTSKSKCGRNKNKSALAQILIQQMKLA